MPKRPLAAASWAVRPAPGVVGGDGLHVDESAALRQLLLELRADVPHDRSPAREADRAHFSEALAALGELALTTDEVEPLLAAACDLLLETLDVDGVALFEETAEGGRLLVRAATGCISGAKGERVEAGAATQAGFALAGRGATATADARAAWMDDAFLVGHGLVAAALAVLPGFTRPRHLVGAYATQRRAFAPDEVRFLEAAGGFVSAAMARCRAEAERKELHTKLAMADRMVSVGTLAAGVAHELNNPLAYVNANISFLADQVGQLGGLLPAPVREEAEVADLLAQLVDASRDARDGVERMRVIVRDLKVLSRGEDGRLGPVELGPVLDSCVNVAWSEIRHRARLVKDLQPVPAVRASAARLGQVFLNLLVNAAQSMPEGHAEEMEIRVSARPQGPGHVVVEVADTGCGISPEVLPRIFDPFFTTKPPGVGTGLGLSIVHGIVRAMEGEIQVESAPGCGSTFRLVLPVAGRADEPGEDDPMAIGLAGAGRPVATARRRILVVDDEPLVGAVLRRTLGHEHEVLVCGGGREALDRLAGGEAVDLVLCDLLMPEMTGMELHAKLCRTRPELADRVVFLTGGACTEAAREFLERPGTEWLDKPFDVAAIRQVVARRLASPGPTAPAAPTGSSSPR